MDELSYSFVRLLRLFWFWYTSAKWLRLCFSIKEVDIFHCIVKFPISRLRSWKEESGHCILCPSSNARLPWNAFPSADLLWRHVTRTVVWRLLYYRLVDRLDDVGFQSFVYRRTFVCSSIEEWNYSHLVRRQPQLCQPSSNFKVLCIERDEFQPCPCWTGGVCRRCILSYSLITCYSFSVSVVCKRVWVIYVLCRPLVFPAPCTAPCTIRILLILLM